MKKTPVSFIHQIYSCFTLDIMARFESPCQILTLFLLASLVAFAVIFVLNLEANKRYGKEEKENRKSYINEIADNLKKFWSSSRREKRSIESENLLSESLNNRKIRHLSQKVEKLDYEQGSIHKP